MKNKPLILVILGPTASGKSALAVKLAKKFDGEVISADSRQVYRGLDIGSGKITKKEMRGIPHHLLDVAIPKRTFTVAQYQKLANKKIKEILKRGKLPIICGGTGFYIQAIVDGIVLPEVPPNKSLRAKLEKKSTEELFKLLKKLDPTRAQNIDAHNPRRLIRAIEITKELGKVPPLQTAEDSPRGFFKERPPQFLQIGLKLSPTELKRRIHRRLFARIRAGMVEEVVKLHKNGISWKRLEDLGLEYRYLSQFLRKNWRDFGDASPARTERVRSGGEPVSKRVKREKIAPVLKQIETASWHYAQRQMTWFKRDPRIKWLKPPFRLDASSLREISRWKSRPTPSSRGKERG